MKLFGKKRYPSHEHILEHESFEQFLANDYLSHEYIVPVHIDEALQNVAGMLAELEGFRGLVNVGSTANGSYEWRWRNNNRPPASDLDYYLIGHHSLSLPKAAHIVASEMRKIGLSVDGALNGMADDNYLDLDDLNGIVDQGDGALLALPFQSFYGVDKASVQKEAIEAISGREDRQEVWNTIASFHAQSLSLHHGTFTDEQNVLIMDIYYPKKVEQFELALSPEDTFAEIELANNVR